MEGQLKVITAFGNQQLQKHLRQKMPEIEFIYEDLQYQEALLDILKKGNPADALILNISLDGQYDSRALIQAIRNIKKGINIIPLFKSTPGEDMQSWLETRGIHYILIDNSFTIEDIYQVLKSERKLQIIEKTLQSNSAGKEIQQTGKGRNDESTFLSSATYDKNVKPGNNTHNAYYYCDKSEDASCYKRGFLSRIYYSVIHGRNHCTKAASNNRRMKNTITIALFGSHPGAGCTHTAISFAWFLSMQKGSKVAVVELGESGTIERLGRNVKHISEKGYEFNGLHLYYNTPITSLIKLKTYSYILLDCGCICRRNETGEIGLISNDNKSALNSDRLQEIERADMKICVCQIKPWQMDETFFLIDSEFGRKDAGDCIFYFTMTDDQTFKEIKKEYSDKNLFKAPYDPEIFNENPERDRMFQTMLVGQFSTGSEILTIP